MFSTKFIQNKNSLCAAFVAVLALLSGCGGFTEDFFGTSCSDASMVPQIANSELYPRYNAARYMQSGKTVVNENHDTLMVVVETFGGCANSAGKFEWDDDFYFADTARFAYTFQGDTLLLTSPYKPDEFEMNQDTFDVTLMLVGGTPGELEGIWLMTQCQKAKGKTVCYDDGYDKYVAFSTGYVEYRINDRKDYDYMSSVFTEGLFIYLDQADVAIQFENVFYRRADAEKLENLSRKYNVEILEKTNKSLKFSHGGRDFELNLDYAAIMDSAAITLTSGDAVCKGVYAEMRNASSEVCNEDNGDYLYKETSGVYSYSRSNHVEFEGCLNGILGRKKE